MQACKSVLPQRRKMLLQSYPMAQVLVQRRHVKYDKKKTRVARREEHNALNYASRRFYEAFITLPFDAAARVT